MVERRRKEKATKELVVSEKVYPTTIPLQALGLPSAHAPEPKYVQGWGSQELWSQIERFGGTLKRRKGGTQIETVAEIEG